MNNRIVRWTVYLVIGVAIGLGVNYYNKQNKMDEGVVELSPDEVQSENIDIPSRFSDPVGSTVEEAIENIPEDLDEAGTAIHDTAEEAMESLEEVMPSDDTAEEDMVEPIDESAEEMAPEEVEETDPALTPMPQ